MHRIARALFAALLLVPALALAQAERMGIKRTIDPREPGGDIFTISAYGGGLTPTGDLISGGRLASNTGGGPGLALSFYPTTNFGVRANGLVAWTGTKNTGTLGSVPGITHWYFDGDLVARYPVGLGKEGQWVAPYAVAGLGARVLGFPNQITIKSSANFLFAFGGGGELRFGQWGVFAEARGNLTSFDARTTFLPSELARFTGPIESHTNFDIAYVGGLLAAF